MSMSHAKAQFVAMLTFTVMYFGAVVVAIYVPVSAADGGLTFVLLDLDAYLACIVAGYLAAAMIRRWGAVAGALTGLLAACLVGIYHFTSGPLTSMPSDWHFWTASILLGGFGGVIWHLRVTLADSRRSI